MASFRSLSLLAQEVRRYDRDRFVLTLFAPSGAREALFALYAFDRETARVRDTAKEPMLARLRLQWWRDCLDGVFSGKGGDSPLTKGLAGAVFRHDLPRWPFDRLLDLREEELDSAPPADIPDFETRAGTPAATVLSLALDILGIHDYASLRAARQVGLAWGITNSLRSLIAAVAAGRALLPLSLLKEHGVSDSLLSRRVEPERVSGIGRHLAGAARLRLEQARLLRGDVPKEAFPVLLTATVAEVYLGRLRARGFDLLNPGWPETRPRPGLLAWRSWRGRY